MTNDNAPPNSIEDKFRMGLKELIAQCMEAGMHSMDMIEIFEEELRVMRGEMARVDREGRT